MEISTLLGLAQPVTPEQGELTLPLHIKPFQRILLNGNEMLAKQSKQAHVWLVSPLDHTNLEAVPTVTRLAVTQLTDEEKELHKGILEKYGDRKLVILAFAGGEGQPRKLIPIVKANWSWDLPKDLKKQLAA